MKCLLLPALLLALLLNGCAGDNPTEPVAAVEDATQTAADTGTEPEPDTETAPDAETAPEPEVLPCDQLPALCEGEPAGDASLGEAVFVAPNDAFPAEVTSQLAHNNLDVAWFDGRLFLAFRTAPNHFASEDAVLYVVSSDDLKSWRYEGHFAFDTDIREPQLVPIDGTLHVYFALLGTDPLNFEPKGSRRATYQSPGEWSQPTEVFEPGFIPWRIKWLDGTLYVTGYTGGANVYDPDGGDIEVYWLTTTDGVQFEPAVKNAPVVLKGGASETDFVFLEDGSLVAVGRNEAGDASGFGMKVCKAPADDLATWTCVTDPRKYDSPLLIEQAGRVWLIGRRSLDNEGNYDLGTPDKPPNELYLDYQLAWWASPKRCSLWEIDPETLDVSWVLDLPSKGDTCFPESIPLENGRHLVFNYTSPVDGEDVPWVDGQFGPTSIYYTVMSLP